MSAARDHIPLKTLLASAICELLSIPYEHAKLMTADQVISLIHRDHYPIRRNDGLKLGMTVEEVDHHSNLVLRSIMAHRQKTAKIDQPQIAKADRCRRSKALHDANMALKAGDLAAADAALRAVADKKRAQPKRKIPSRPFPKGHRPLRSRSNLHRATT